MYTVSTNRMVRRLLVALLVASMLVTLVPVASVAADTQTDVVATHSTGIDAQIIDRFRTGTPTAGVARTDTDGVLDQPTRASVYDAVRASPGVNLATIAATVGVTKSTVRYHVDVLGDAGLVETARIAGVVRVAPAEADAELAGALRSESIGSVLEAVADEEPASVTTLAETTERAMSTVSHHLSTLEERGYVDRTRRGEAVVTTLTPEVRRSVAAIRDTVHPADD
jgi:DNA-binding transcriptional ArsR family regulator